MKGSASFKGIDGFFVPSALRH